MITFFRGAPGDKCQISAYCVNKFRLFALFVMRGRPRIPVNVSEIKVSYQTYVTSSFASCDEGDCSIYHYFHLTQLLPSGFCKSIQTITNPLLLILLLRGTSSQTYRPVYTSDLSIELWMYTTTPRPEFFSGSRSTE